MKVLIANRNLIYQILNAAFKTTQTVPKIAELGVLTGANAEDILKTTSPERLYLVDAWSISTFQEYEKNNAHRPWTGSLNDFSYYFGGPLTEQATLDKLHQQAVDRFQGKQNVTFIRKNTRDAIPDLKKHLGPAKLDLIYVDASHQYESVLDDLMEYRQFLDPNGFFQLNDCCHSPQGMKQNLGVLEATVKFCKVANFLPLLITNTDWSDVLLVSRTSPMVSVIDRIVMSSDVPFVEIPEQLLGSLSVRTNKRSNLSFC